MTRELRTAVLAVALALSAGYVRSMSLHHLPKTPTSLRPMTLADCVSATRSGQGEPVGLLARPGYQSHQHIALSARCLATDSSVGRNNCADSPAFEHPYELDTASIGEQSDSKKKAG